MPLYEYKCSDCEEEFSLKLKLGESPESCTHCDSPNFKKLFRASTVVFERNDNKRSKPGTLVKKYIEEVRRETEEYKEGLQKEW